MSEILGTGLFSAWKAMFIWNEKQGTGPSWYSQLAAFSLQPHFGDPILTAVHRKATDSGFGSTETCLKNLNKFGKKSTILFSVAHNKGRGTQIVNYLSAELVEKVMTWSFHRGISRDFLQCCFYLKQNQKTKRWGRSSNWRGRTGGEEGSTREIGKGVKMFRGIAQDWTGHAMR